MKLKEAAELCANHARDVVGGKWTPKTAAEAVRRECGREYTLDDVAGSGGSVTAHEVVLAASDAEIAKL